MGGPEKAPRQSTAEGATAKRKRLLPVKWRDRFLAGFLWAAIIYLNTHLFHEFPLPIFLQPVFDPQYRLARWIVYLVFFVLLVLWLRLRTLWFLFYFWMFPFVCPALILWGVASRVPRFTGRELLIVFVWSAIDAGTRMTSNWRRSGFAAVAMLPTCYLIVLVTSNKYFLAPTAFVLLFLSAWILWGTFRWAASPLDTFTFMVDRTLTFSRQGVKDETFSIDTSSADSGEKFKKGQKKIESERRMLKAVQWVRSVLVTEKSLVAMFVLVLLAAILMTTLNFGFLYYNLYKIDPEQFLGVGQRVGLGDFWYFSTTVLIMSDFSPLRPGAGLVRLVTVAEWSCSLLLLTILVLMFTAIRRQNLDQANQALNNVVETHKNELDRWEEILKRPPLRLPSG